MIATTMRRAFAALSAGGLLAAAAASAEPVTVPLDGEAGQVGGVAAACTGVGQTKLDRNCAQLLRAGGVRRRAKRLSRGCRGDGQPSGRHARRRRALRGAVGATSSAAAGPLPRPGQPDRFGGEASERRQVAAPASGQARCACCTSPRPLSRLAARSTRAARRALGSARSSSA